VLTLLVVPVAFVQMERIGNALLAIWHRISPPEEADAAPGEEQAERAEADQGGSAAK
jgi:hypothetical protein